MNRMCYRLLPMLLVLMGVSVYALDIVPNEKGISIESGNLIKLTLGYPSLGTRDNKQIKPSGDAKINGSNVELTYPDGTILRIGNKDGHFSYQFNDLSDHIKSLKFEMNLPLALGEGAQWSMEHSPLKPFPSDASADPFLYKGNAKHFAISKDNDGFTMKIEHGYQQLQDNRKWNDKKFYWMATTQMPRVDGNKAYYSIQFTTHDDKPLAEPKGQTSIVKPAEKLQPDTTSTDKVAVKLTDKGIMLDMHSAGQITMAYPKLNGLKPTTPAKIANESSVRTHLEYVDGVTATISLDDQRQIRLDFYHLSDQVKSLRMEMPLPISLAKGGKFAIEGGKTTPFPAEKPDKPFLYQGNQSSITIIHPTGPGFTLTMPKYGFQQLQDNREWNWNIFYWWYGIDLPSGQSTATFQFKVDDLAGGPVKAKAVVDPFGQWVESDYPGKVHSLEELKQDAIEDEQYYGSLTPPTRDSFGGIPGTGKKYNLKATGYFHLEKINGKDILVTPQGNAFFQLGVCGLTPCDDYTRVRGREDIYAWLPSERDPEFKSAWRPNDSGVFSFLLANRIRKTGKPYNQLEYVDMWIQRELKWGFNSLGAFCPTGGEVHDLLVKHNYPFVNHLPLNSLKQIPGVHLVWDPFVPGIEEQIDKLMAKYASTYANDPLLIGSFIINEPTIEDTPKVVPLLKASESPAKAKLISMLQDKYPNVADLCKAWEIVAGNYEQIGQMPLKVTTKDAFEDVQAFFGVLLDRRYKLVHDAFRKHMPNHMLIGDRLQPGTSNNELLINTMGKYLDIVTINYYADGIDRNYLDRIHRWSGGKPMILSEFYYTCPDESGLQGGRGLKTQEQRGLAYRNYVEQAAATGYVVGIEWFINVDQTVTGRFFQGFNGEANNTGLVSVADRPYKDMLKHMMVTNNDVFSVIDGSREPYLLDDPRFTLRKGGTKKTVTIDRLVNAFELDGKRSEWPGSPPNLVSEPGAKIEGNFRMAWDQNNLYLYAEVNDDTPLINHQNGGNIWNGDALELFIGYEKTDTVGNMIYSDRQIILRGALTQEGQNNAWLANTTEQMTIESIVVPMIDGKGYFVEARIPFKSLGFDPKPNQTLLFDLALDNVTNVRAPRSEQVLFNGTKLASRDRGVWGKAKLMN